MQVLLHLRVFRLSLLNGNCNGYNYRLFSSPASPGDGEA